MSLKSFCVGLCLCACALTAQAATCSKGIGTAAKQLEGGTVLQVGPGLTADQASKCRAALVAPSGATEYETVAAELTIDPMTGRDMNGDGKPDIILQAHNPDGYKLIVLTSGEQPALQREISNGMPFTIDDRDGDGKLEIWTRDTAFAGIDDLSDEESPYPAVVFRLKGRNMFYVSPLFWTDYEMDIKDAQSRVPQKDIDSFHIPPASDSQKEAGDITSGGGHGKGMASDKVRAVKSVVLTVVLDYLYAGKGGEAWKALNEMWPYNDRDRIRQAILRTRQNGVLREMSKPAPSATPQQAANPQKD